MGIAGVVCISFCFAQVCVYVVSPKLVHGVLVWVADYYIYFEWLKPIIYWIIKQGLMEEDMWLGVFGQHMKRWQEVAYCNCDSATIVLRVKTIYRPSVMSRTVQ